MIPTSTAVTSYMSLRRRMINDPPLEMIPGAIPSRSGCYAHSQVSKMAGKESSSQRGPCVEYTVTGNGAQLLSLITQEVTIRLCSPRVVHIDFYSDEGGSYLGTEY
jgi:hypothetical protein